MRLTIVAATGGIGRELLTQAAAAGHEVTAVVRNAAKLPPGAARVVTADLSTADPTALEDAVGGADAVLSALGPRPGGDRGVAWRGTASIVEAMKATGVRRVVAVSAAPIGTVASPARPHPPRYDAGDGPLIRYLLGPILKTALRDHYADLARMEDVLRDSCLDWTVVRPPKLTDKPLTGHYRTACDRNLRGGWSIPRADVAHFMLHTLERPETINHTIAVAT